MTWFRDPSTGFVPHVSEYRDDPKTGRKQCRTRLMGDYGEDSWSRWHDVEHTAGPVAS